VRPVVSATALALLGMQDLNPQESAQGL
jgi:hypothetical protein